MLTLRINRSLIFFMVLVFILGLSSVVVADKLVIEIKDNHIVSATIVSDLEADLFKGGKVTSYEKKMTMKERAILQEVRRKAFKTVPFAVQYLYTHAEKHHKMGNFEESILYSRLTTALDPSFSRAHDLKVICFKILKNYDEGMKEYNYFRNKYSQNIDFVEYLETLQLAKDQNELLAIGIREAVNRAISTYRKNQVQGMESFESVLTIFHKASRYDDEIYAILQIKKVLEESENWIEAIKVCNKYLQMKRSEINIKDWRSIKKQYTEIFKDVFRYFSELNDYEGYSNWIKEYARIENKRFAEESSDMIKFYEGKALMRNRDYENAQSVFLNIYLNHPSSSYSKEAKTYYDRIKQAIKGVAIVSITTDPPRAEVHIDGLIRGKTPIKIEVSDRDHNLKITKKAYDTFEEKIIPNAAEGDLVLDLTLKSSVLSFKAARRNYCPGIVLTIINVGEIKWHKDCFGLHTLEIDGPFEKIDENSVRLPSGEYSVKACSFGELYKETGKYIHSTLVMKPDKKVMTTVNGAYIDDPKYPYKVEFKTQ